jgi:hypothetical protein
MNTIKIMADYHCFPIWKSIDGGVENINPDDLPISNDLKRDLHNWSEEFDSTLNADDPANSGFLDEISKVAFEKNGLKLTDRLRQELGVDFSVNAKIGPYYVRSC